MNCDTGAVLYRTETTESWSRCDFLLKIVSGVSPRMNYIASRDQYEARIGENLVVNYFYLFITV